MNNMKRPIFGIFPESVKIGQLFDLQDECFLESCVLKTDLSPAIRVYDEKNVKVEFFNRPFFAEFISSLSDDLLTQLKAYATLGIFKTLTTDTRIFSPNSDALISIKFTFRKKVLKLKDMDSNALELNETFIAKSQFAVTEVEMGQWILVSVSAKIDLKDISSKLESIQTFLENYFTNNEISEIPNEASDFLYKFVTSESNINHQQKPAEYISFKEFFESLKLIWDKHRCFPISVKLTSLLELGFFTIDNRLETLQSSRFNSHKFFLQFFRESEMAIFNLQKALTSHLKIFTVIILKKLRQSEICLMEIMEKFKKISIYDKQKLEILQSEIENIRFLQTIETFIQNLETKFAAKQPNFIELQTQKLFSLSPTNVKFVLIIGENEKQKTDFINFLINASQCSNFEEARTYKMTTFLPYSNLSPRKTLVLTKNNETTICITITGMDYCSTTQTKTTNEVAKIFRGGRYLNTVILLFSQSNQLQSFEKWIPKQLSKATNNFIYFNFYSKKSIKSQKWKSLAEILPTGPLYFLNQKILKQNFIQMSKADLEIGIQNIHQILRKINQSKIIEGIEGDTVMDYVKDILDICKDLIEHNELILYNVESDVINLEEKADIEKVLPVFITNLANLCKFINDPNINAFYANFISAKYYVIWDTVMRLDSLSSKEIKNVCDEIITLPIFGPVFQQKLLQQTKTDIIFYNCETKSGISFFSERTAFSWNNEKVFEKY